MDGHCARYQHRSQHVQSRSNTKGSLYSENQETQAVVGLASNQLPSLGFQVSFLSLKRGAVQGDFQGSPALTAWNSLIHESLT